MYFGFILKYWVLNPMNPQEFGLFGGKTQYELVMILNYRFFFNHSRNHSSKLECSEHLAQSLRGDFKLKGGDAKPLKATLTSC